MTETKTRTRTPATADDAATLLLAARHGHSAPLHGLPDALRPQTEADAYAIQHAVIARLGPIGGWKVGSPNPQSTHFTCAPIPAAAIFATISNGAPTSEVTIHGSDRVVEAEIAVRLGQDLPPRDLPYTEADIRAAIASAHPAIEVLQTRYADLEAAGALAGLADSLSNHSLVLGPAVADWSSVDLDAETVRLLADGTEIKRGAGNPGGEMLRLVMWLANGGTHWAGGLRAGQVVTTGSWTGKDATGPGQTVVAHFARCGAATVVFAA